MDNEKKGDWASVNYSLSIYDVNDVIACTFLLLLYSCRSRIHFHSVHS